jgi:hypothetical protein
MSSSDIYTLLFLALEVINAVAVVPDNPMSNIKSKKHPYESLILLDVLGVHVLRAHASCWILY